MNVNPLAIDQSLFKTKRRNLKQEQTRQLILKAFQEMRKDSRYTRCFETFIPEKTWEVKTVRELRCLASEVGNHIADWVDQALVWAQQIYNGESWKDICNKPDTANCYRLVRGENGYYWRIGGSSLDECNKPAAHVSEYSFNENYHLAYTVPLVKVYRE